MTLEEGCWRMHGKDTTVLCLLMDKLAVENPTLWWAMGKTKVY